MCRELTAAGTREPQYSVVAFIMKATVYANFVIERAQNGHKTGTKRAQNGQEKILRMIEADATVSIQTIAEKCGISVKLTRTLLEKMKEGGMIQRVGPNRGGHWKIISPQK
jgi:ATP-dependent DNA helicase RecG